MRKGGPRRAITSAAGADPEERPPAAAAGGGPRGRGSAELSRFRVVLEVLKDDLEVGHVLPAPRGVLAQAADEDLLDLGGKDLMDLGGGPRLLVEDGGQRRHRRLAVEGSDAREHLVEDGAEGEDIRPGVDLLPLGLLRGHVIHGPQDEAFVGQRPLRPAEGHGRAGGGDGFGDPLGQLGQAEVEDLDPAVVRDHDVRRLEVAVDDPGGVGPGQPVGDLDGVFERFGELQALAPDQMVEGPPLDVFHDDEVRAAVRSDVVDDDDVGMVERRGGLGLLSEALLPLGVGRLFAGEDLDRDDAVEVGVLGLVNDSHPAFPDLLEEAVMEKRPAGDVHRRWVLAEWTLNPPPA